ncbi:L,D-transpeptidase family protein [Sphingomonas sp.]|uniref:L,D-transpeptidase family protein n=1 Tax=Sphingomonas sp. TaxID=28214 RepID=UPI0035BC2D84
MARPKTILATLGLLLPAALAGAIALAAHREPATSPQAKLVRQVPLPRPRLAPAPAPKASPAPAYVVRRVLDVPGVMKIGDTYWDEAGVPAGAVVITVDLEAKVLSIFRGGYEIGTAAVLYGGDDKPTPLGIFPVTQKDARHVSNLYHAPMPYMMRLTNDGVSIHGSPKMEAGLMTHGCVGVPVAFAAKLFRATKLGDKVIVTRGERLDIGKPITAA